MIEAAAARPPRVVIIRHTSREERKVCGHAATPQDSCLLPYSPAFGGTKGLVPFCVISPAIAGLYACFRTRGSGNGAAARDGNTLATHKTCLKEQQTHSHRVLAHAAVARTGSSRLASLPPRRRSSSPSPGIPGLAVAPRLGCPCVAASLSYTNLDWAVRAAATTLAAQAIKTAEYR